MSEARLDEYDKREWFDVARKLKPGLTEAEYDGMWERFIAMKAEHERLKGLS
jgi:hypothetical protein